MSAELDQLALEVAETKGVQESAVALLLGVQAQLAELAAELEAASIDNTKVLALAAELDASTNALAEAVAAQPA